MIGSLVLVASLIGVSQCVTFVIEPFNTSAAIGSTGTLACIATNLGSDSVSWKKKQSSGNGYDSLTFGTNIVTSIQNKYTISGTANLTISNVASTDEGLYQCAIGSVTREISFTPVILPNNVSVYWENSPQSGNVVNITCRATYGNPPPYLKWFKGPTQMELTQNAYYYTTNVRSSGYGDAVSSMALSLTGSDQNQEIRCEAAYDGYERAMEYTLNIQLSGSSSLKAQGLLAALFVACSLAFKSL
ncbi:V-set and immunoglobulin domain-containing protein 1-like [Ostrea edulis]|uniref:V-set and immunoglobulin domain-containing protein 1-like n=1 Tax=Ostrea edulis TaxID=37623 RepID=UPI002095D27E|nr:V-set and immunoglobulin domain-containing protein 1-like [Ostrea edulis]